VADTIGPEDIVHSSSRLIATVVLTACLTLGACATSSTAPPTTGPPAGVAAAPAAVPAYGLIDETPRLLVMTAMPSEIAPLLERADIERTVELKGRRHYLGRLGGVEVVMVAAGISMVNATLGTQLAIDRFHLTGILFCGIAGGANPDVGIADVTFPARWSEYQEHVFTDESRRGWRRGWRNPELGNFGIMHPQRVRVVSPDTPVDDEALRLWFNVDKAMLETARAASSSVTLERCNQDGHCVEGEPTVVIGGNGVSGPTFVDDKAYREFIWEIFTADAIDMETAAVGHVAMVNGIPYGAVRSISDLAGATPHENKVTTFGPLAAANAAAFVEAFLVQWSRQ
jgi:adenosylhomocysteine nucleosidase